MKISIVAYTRISDEVMWNVTGEKWAPPTHPEFIDNGAILAEFCGRGCYESWSRPNPETATTSGYIGNIIEHEHFSVLEHGTVSIHFEGVSRSFTHELVRHRHFSFSQLSQRFQQLGEARRVVPELFRGDEEAETLVTDAWLAAVLFYQELLPVAERRAEEQGYTGLMAKKRALEAARCVLPNMTPTKIVVSGNHRSWIEFLLKRGGTGADLEIRKAAFQVLELLQGIEPSIYKHLAVMTSLADNHETFIGWHK